MALKILRMKKVGEFKDPYGILDTPCYPSRYYCGYLRFYSNGDAVPANNATHLFHRKLSDAEHRFALEN